MKNIADIKEKECEFFYGVAKGANMGASESREKFRVLAESEKWSSSDILLMVLEGEDSGFIVGRLLR